MKKSQLFLFLAFSALLTSCNKSDDDTVGTERRPQKIERTDGTESEVFKYDDNGRIKEFVKTYKNKQDTYVVLYQDQKVNKISVTYKTNGETTNVQTIAVAYIENNKINLNSDTGTSSFTYDNHGNIVTMISLDGAQSYSYDDKGNLLSFTQGNQTYNYGYTSLKGVMSGVKSPKWLLTILGTQFANQRVNAPVNGNGNTESVSYFYDESAFVNGYPSKIQFNVTTLEAGTSTKTFLISY